MKKIIVLLCLTICVLFNGANTVYAQDCLKNFYGYEVKNINIRDFGEIVKNAIESYGGADGGKPLADVENAYVYTGKDYTYFVRLYPANQNTNIYIVSNQKYDVNNNEITEFLRKSGYVYGKLDDKNALKEYQFDFYSLARKQKLGDFYISPDLVKPLKTGMSKLNNKLAKNNKKTSVIQYSEDSEEINLTCIDTTTYNDDNAKISIVQNEYRLKEKSNKYVHAHEYLITNKNTSTAFVSVSSERLAGLKDVTTEAFVDLDRLDLVDTVASFPPVVICTAGLSLVGSVPNWVRLARITKEASRYAKSLPQNYELKPQKEMRILVLKYKENKKPLNFTIKIQNQTYKMSF